LPGVETFWTQDIQHFLSSEMEGKWITAEEVESQIGNDLLEMIRKNLIENRTLYCLTLY